MEYNYGCEFEAIGHNYNNVKYFLNKNNIYDWDVVIDESIDDTHISEFRSQNAFELVSPILSGYEGLNKIHKVINLMNDINAYVNYSCGFHVHIDMRLVSYNHFKNIMNRFRTFENDWDSLVDEGRIDNIWINSLIDDNHYDYFCHFMNKANSMDELKAFMFNEKYILEGMKKTYKLNVKSLLKYGTLEFRQHQGTLDFDEITNWIMFIQQFVKASETMTDDDSLFRGISRSVLKSTKIVQAI